MTVPEEPGPSLSTPAREPEHTPDVSAVADVEAEMQPEPVEEAGQAPSNEPDPVQVGSTDPSAPAAGAPRDAEDVLEEPSEQSPPEQSPPGQSSVDVSPVVHDERVETADPEPSEPAAPVAPATPWRRLMSACKPHMSRAQVLAAVLCAVLGFALVVQLRQTKQDEFANLRQSDLVRILDDVTRRSEDLDRELSSLLRTEFELRSGTDSQRAALELAEQDAATQGILSGRLPAEGPGIEITIVEGTTKISASRMFNVLEELRNAGAEVIEVNGIRMVTSSYFVDADRGIVIDGIAASAPYRWAVIGDPVTLGPAMEIPGGALPTIRFQGGRTTIEQRELVEVKAVREPEEPEFATPGVDNG